MTQLLGTKGDRAILHRNAHSRDRVAVAKCSGRKTTVRVRLAGTRVPKEHQKTRPETTSGAPGESHDFAAVLLPLDQRSVAVVACGGIACVLVPVVSVVALAILPADVKTTSRAPIPRP